ncbi:hypothetical protein ABZ215_25060 [Amycolatopsis sp. NPDC006131]|uniref:hypothetical protein n=1 Tax=Amycolatopsis sp. NPDC006131 TaxID=3156731 RepID=UPI0033A1FCA6
MKLGALAAVTAAGLLLAACGGEDPPAASPTPRTTPAPVTTTSSLPLPETGMMDEARAILIRQTVPTVEGVDTPRLMNLADSFCRQLRGSTSARHVFESALDQGFSEADAFGLMSSIVVTTCPSVMSKVTHDAVGWHP